MTDKELPPIWKVFGVDEPDDLPNPPPVDEGELRKFVKQQEQSEESTKLVAYNIAHYKVWRDALRRLLERGDLNETE